VHGDYQYRQTRWNDDIQPGERNRIRHHGSDRRNSWVNESGIPTLNEIFWKDASPGK
jgi:hypothetical protein